MTMFDEVLGQVDAAIDDIYGEYFSYEPRIETLGGESEADPDRAPLARVLGVFSMAAMHLTEQGGRQALGYVSALPRFSFVTGQLPSPVRRLDRFIRLKDSAVYEVTAALPDGINRTSVELVALP
jgi:hypothetical protein